MWICGSLNREEASALNGELFTSFISLIIHKNKILGKELKFKTSNILSLG